MSKSKAKRGKVEVWAVVNSDGHFAGKIDPHWIFTEKSKAEALRWPGSSIIRCRIVPITPKRGAKKHGK